MSHAIFCRRVRLSALILFGFLAASLSAEPAFLLRDLPDRIMIKSADVTFVIPRQPPNGGLLQMDYEGKWKHPTLPIMQVTEQNRKVYVCTDNRDNRLTILKDDDLHKVVAGDYSLSVCEKGQAVRPFADARLHVTYQAVSGVPGLVITHRLKALQPLSLHKFNLILAPFRFTEMAVDSQTWKPFPQTLQARKGGTGSRQYVLGKTAKGNIWYFSREASAYLPQGSFFVPYREHLSSTTGKSMPAEQTVQSSLVIGRVKTEEDLGNLNTLRLVAGEVTENAETSAVNLEGELFATELKKDVTSGSPDWNTIPVLVTRRETKDYRPKAALMWGGPQDLSFTFKAAYDSQYLYLKIDVTDDLVTNQFQDSTMWLGDSIQFGIDPLCEKNANHYITFGICMGKKPGVWCFAHPDKTLLGDMNKIVKNQSRLRPGGIDYELAIPWDFLRPFEPIRGKMGFNFTVIDQDKGTHYENWMGITDGVFGGVDPKLFWNLNLKSVESVLLATQKVPEPKTVFPYHVIMKEDPIAFSSYVVVAQKNLPANLVIRFNGKALFSKPLKPGFNTASHTMPPGTLAPGHYDVVTAVEKNGKQTYSTTQQLSVLNEDFLTGLNHKLMQRLMTLDQKLEELKAKNIRATDITVLTEMIRYFTAFTQQDVKRKEVCIGHRLPIPVDQNRKRYIYDRAFDNITYCMNLATSLLKQTDQILDGTQKPFTTPDFQRGVTPVIDDGGFKVNGREVFLFGPQTWTNVRNFVDDHFIPIGKTGFNFVNVFYVGGKRRENLIRLAEQNNLYFSYGLTTPTIFNEKTSHDPYYAGRIKNPGHYLAPMTNISPNMVFSVAQPEQFPRKYENTTAWATEFQAYLKTKFKTLEAMNQALGLQLKDFQNITYAVCLQYPTLKYESFLYRLDKVMPLQKSDSDFKRTYAQRPVSTHYSTHYNLTGLDPLVVLADFERLWNIFDVIGWDGGIGMDGSAYAIDFSKGTIDCDLARSFYPDKPQANNEAHIFNEASYDRYSYAQTYVSHILAHLHGLNAASIWVWCPTGHYQGEYAFTRADTYHPTIWVSLHLQTYAEEIAAFRKQDKTPFRILHSLPSMTDRDTYMKSLYQVYEGCYFSGWPVRFLSERMLDRKDFQNTKIIVVPEARRIAQNTFDRLADFARNGGVVVTFGMDALTCDEYGKPCPQRQTALKTFIRHPNSGPSTYAQTLNELLHEHKLEFPAKLTDQQGKTPFGVEYRVAKAKDGTPLMYLVNLTKTPVTVKIPGKWQDIMTGKPFSGTKTLNSLDFHLLRNRR